MDIGEYSRRRLEKRYGAIGYLIMSLERDLTWTVSWARAFPTLGEALERTGRLAVEWREGLLDREMVVLAIYDLGAQRILRSVDKTELEQSKDARVADTHDWLCHPFREECDGGATCFSDPIRTALNDAPRPRTTWKRKRRGGVSTDVCAHCGHTYPAHQSTFCPEPTDE